MDEALEIIVSGDKLPQMDLSHMGGNGFNPLHELMRAIILRTVDDYHSKSEFKEEAIEYMFSDEEEHIFSFNAICRHLGFDPAKTRHEIMNTKRKISTRRRAA